MLDVSLRLGVLNLLSRIQQEEHIGMLYITHDLATARHFSDEIMVMCHGDIIEHGPSDDVILNPQQDYTKCCLMPRLIPRSISRRFVMGVASVMPHGIRLIII